MRYSFLSVVHIRLFVGFQSSRINQFGLLNFRFVSFELQTITGQKSFFLPLLGYGDGVTARIRYVDGYLSRIDEGYLHTLKVPQQWK